MNKYLVIEGLDGSGSSYTYDGAINKYNFKPLDNLFYYRPEIYSQDINWWEMGDKFILDRFDYYLKRNISQNFNAKENRSKYDIVQLKSFFSSIITNGYFLNRDINKLINRIDEEVIENLIKPDLTIAIYASSIIRKKRMEFRKQTGFLTKFDLLTLEDDYEKFWISSLNKLFDMGIFGKGVIVNNDNSNFFEVEFDNTISNL